jgi:septal ring factor EnvC (AmiA/AmiB activator)
VSIEDRVVNLEQAFLALMKRDDDRHDTVGESIKLLTEMIEHHEKRLDGVHEEQSNADGRIAALADAQIRTEDALKELSTTQSHADERIAALADAQIRTEGALAKLTEKLDRLADTVERHIKEGH